MRKYFGSGWAFLLPYLALYLLYYWRQWPANDFAPLALGNGGAIPALRHVFWLLHLCHGLLAIVALRSWWRASAAMCPPGDSFPWRMLQSLAPWALLTLLFAIPGAYLEWPADPWEHLFRLNEWQHLAAISDKLLAKNFSYFFAYSFVGGASGLDAASHLRGYHTAISLLLAWQYFRLARSTGLSVPASTLFVVLQAVLFGNNIFSFFRYYGLASTLLAQVGAVAAMRVVIAHLDSGRSSWPVQVKCAASIVALAALIAVTHPQGLGIAALGIAAAVVHHGLAHWRPRTLAVIGAGLVAANAGVLLWAQNHPLITHLIEARWLSPWGGFNLLSPSSPAAHRAIEILGLFGLINLGAALLLLRSHLLIACLTLVPFAALCLPVGGVAFALGSGKAENILLFNRMFFAVPCGLAIVAAVGRAFRTSQPQDHARSSGFGRWTARCPRFRFHFLVGCFTALVLAPSDYPYFCRLWNGVQVVPADLRQGDVLGALGEMARAGRVTPDTQLLAPRYVGYLAQATGHPQKQPFPGYRFLIPPGVPSAAATAFVSAIKPAPLPGETALILVPSPLALVSPASSSGLLSRHWSPHQVHLERTGAAEAWESAALNAPRGMEGSGPVFTRAGP